MSGFFCSVFLLVIAFAVNALVIPRTDGQSKRVLGNSLSDEEHYNEEQYHNPDYDHEAFLGEKEAKKFDELTPEESIFRLGKIVDKIDSNKDGFVSMQELKDWILHTQRKYIIEDSSRQWKGLNPKNESDISWEYYKKSTYGFIEDNEVGGTFSYRDMIEKDLRRWKKADQDENGVLNYNEFTDFVHPEDSAHMKDIVILETMEDIDKNGDGKISMEEYIGDMYNDDDTDLEAEPGWVTSERSQFTEYRDKDKSGFLEFEEVRNWILPDNYDNSEAEAKHLIYEADLDRDNQLSREEILKNYDLFVGSQATDFGEALMEHDEF